jgi:predicted MPP superfamily phosphohydrolase
VGLEGNWEFAVSTAIDAAVVCAVVVWAVRTRPGWARLASVCASALLLLALKGVAMVVAGLHVPFGVMHVLWLDLIVVVPVAAALVGLLAWRTGGLALRVAVVLGVLAAPLGIYASLVEPSRLVTEAATVDLAPERAGEAPVRVAVVADLQFDRLGDHEREAVERVMAELPDLILLSGDYHQGTPESFARELPGLRELMGRLRAPGGVFAVQGDVDGVAEARAAFAGTGVRLLIDREARTRVRDREIAVAGLRLNFRGVPARELIRRLERRPGAREVRLLLAHRPDAVLQLETDTRVDLVVSGHTHGGQLQLPLIGPLMTASDVPRAVAAGGLHSLEGRRIYVSRGIGVERDQAPRLRLGAAPEISVLTLR